MILRAEEFVSSRANALDRVKRVVGLSLATETDMSK